MYDDILLFVKLVKCGGFGRASNNIGIPQPTISRRIKNLEEELRLTLIKRNSHNFETTQHGSDLYELFKNHEQTNQLLIDKLYDNQHILSGILNVSLPPGFSSYVVDPYLGDFARKYPQLQLNLFYDFREINMHKDNLDIAITSFKPSQQLQKIKRIYTSKWILCCTQKYIDNYGFLREIEDRTKHVILAPILPDNSRPTEIELFHEGYDETITIPIIEKVRITNQVHAKNMIMCDNVIAGIQEKAVLEELANGKIVRVLPDYYLGMLEFFWMTNLNISDARHKAFYTFVMECIAKIEK